MDRCDDECDDDRWAPPVTPSSFMSALSADSSFKDKNNAEDLHWKLQHGEVKAI